MPSRSFRIDPSSSLAVPLAHTHSQIHIRPSGMLHQYTYSSSAVTWEKMLHTSDRMFTLGTCHSHKGHNYRFAAEITRERVLVERSTRMEQLAHRITLHPTLKLVNLLPVDMQYIILGESGIVKAGQKAALTHVGCCLLTKCKWLQISEFCRWTLRRRFSWTYESKASKRAQTC